MVTITIPVLAFIAILIIGVLSFDAIGSGILYIVHHLRKHGSWWLAGGLAGVTLFLTLLSRYVTIHPVIILIPAVLGLLTVTAVTISDNLYLRKIKKSECNIKWINYIIAFFKYCGLDEVQFIEDSYGNGSPKPWCRRWDGFIESVRLSKDNPNAIVLSVKDKNGRTIESQFDENSDEDFKSLFYEVYNATKALNIYPELETWIKWYESSWDLRWMIMKFTEAKSVSYDMKADTLEVIVPKWDDGTKVTSALFHLFEDQGYYKVQYNTESGPFDGSGMFDEDDEIHPDIKDDAHHITVKPYWLNRILDQCDIVDFTPAYINFIVD